MNCLHCGEPIQQIHIICRKENLEVLIMETKAVSTNTGRKLKWWQVILLILAALILLVALLYATGALRRIVVSASRSSEPDTIAATKANENYNLFSEGLDELLDIAYIDDGGLDHLLDVYRPSGTDALLPVIINVHGGGLVAGEKEVNTVQSRWFAQQGFAVVNTNYTRLPDTNYAGMIQNIYDVLHWVEDNAEKLHFDLDRVYMTGDSGGGHIVSIAAAVNRSKELETWYGVEAPGYRVQKFALTCPMVGTAELVHPKSLAYFIFHFTIGPEIYGDADAMAMANIYTVAEMSDYPPILLLTTSGDTNFYSGVMELDSFLTTEGIVHKLKVYENQSHELYHVFNVDHPEWEESMEANGDIVAFFSSK